MNPPSIINQPPTNVITEDCNLEVMLGLRAEVPAKVNAEAYLQREGKRKAEGERKRKRREITSFNSSL